MYLSGSGVALRSSEQSFIFSLIHTNKESNIINYFQNSGVTEAVVRGSVTKNIAKFEKRREEAELERERSISPKRSPVRRGKSGSGRSPGRPRSALSPERKPGSPERRVKHRVSWGDDQLVQVGFLLDNSLIWTLRLEFCYGATFILI